MVSERGMVNGEMQVVKPHKDFRLFLTLDPTFGEISRAMRNRGIEVLARALDQLLLTRERADCVATVAA